jgi:nitroreductase
MNRRTFLKAVPAVTLLAGTKSGLGQELKTINLMEPQKDGGKSVLAALWERKTTRDIGTKELPPQMLSNLLWAAFGINRQKGPSAGGTGRTAASASNSQEIDLYVALPEGVYLYEAAGHRLKPVAAGDFRSRSGRRAAANAPVNIFFVVDLAKYAKAPFQEPGLKNTDVQKSYYYVVTGLIASNVYLFAASQGLAAHFHNCDKSNTPEEFKLRPDQRVLFAQTVGYPAS